MVKRIIKLIRKKPHGLLNDTVLIDKNGIETVINLFTYPAYKIIIENNKFQIYVCYSADIFHLIEKNEESVVLKVALRLIKK